MKETAIGRKTAAPFSWEIDSRKTTVWVETDYPHRIQSLEVPDGSGGSLVASRREPYRQRNAVGYSGIRRKPGLREQHLLTGRTSWHGD